MFFSLSFPLPSLLSKNKEIKSKKKGGKEGRTEERKEGMEKGMEGGRKEEKQKRERERERTLIIKCQRTWMNYFGLFVESKTCK